jgi:hypothetical protein
MACPKQKMFLAAFISVVSSYDISNVIKNPPILIAIYGYFHRQPGDGNIISSGFIPNDLNLIFWYLIMFGYLVKNFNMCINSFFCQWTIFNKVVDVRIIDIAQL